MAEQTPKLKRRIRRAVILTAGSAAEAVAEKLEALSQAWLGTEPPLAVVRSATQGDLEGEAPAVLSALNMACDRLASGEVIGKLQAAGYTLARPDEIQLWVIVDVAGDLESPSGHLAELPPLLALLADTVWQRTRIHVTTRGLLLAAPVTEVRAAQWARRLGDAGVEQVTIAGPVDAARAYWDPGTWQTRAATALATLLWSEVVLPNSPGLSGPETVAEAGQAVGVWSIGAAAWQAPLAQIRQHVAIRCALGMVERLSGSDAERQQAARERSGAAFREAQSKDAPLGSDQLPPWELPRLAVAPERHRLALEGAVPPEPAAQVWGRQWPAWRALPKVPAALRATAEQCAAQAHAEQYTPRGEWLDGQAAAWETALRQLQGERLQPVTGWPRVARYHQELAALTVQLQAACMTIEDWLEAAGQRFEEATTKATQALEALEGLCAGIPAPGRATAWATLLQPWRWPALVWAYGVMLPRYAQKYLDAAYRQGQARWVEANTHALRQAYLAMAQVTHEHQATVKQVFTTLTEAQAELAEQLEGLGAPPEPWDETGLQRLAESLTPETWPAAWRLAGTWEHLATTILGWVEERLGDLAIWTAADCLASTADDAELAQRLGRLADTALPLWPGTDQEAAAALWLIWPARAAEGGFHSAEERLQSALQAWTGGHAGERLHMHAAAGSASALLVLRATAVTLDGQGQEVL